MAGGFCCQICGNTIENGTMVCPYCNQQQEEEGLVQPGPATPYRVINLERGMPPAKQAMNRLRTELDQSRSLGIKVLILIHGYGSSGRGGRIRDEVRQYLCYLGQRGEINQTIHGEDLTRRAGQGKELFKRFPFLIGNRELEPTNPGITVVVL